MAIVLNISDNKYIGTLKATATIYPGYFVTPDYSAGTASAVADGTAALKNVPVVCNVNNHIDEEAIDDSAHTVAKDEYLRLHFFKVGEMLTTDKFGGTYKNIKEDDTFVVGSGGAIEAYSEGTYNMEFIVREKTTLNGAEALKLICVKA